MSPSDRVYFCNKKLICVTLIHFLPLIKQVSQFLIKGELLLERERGEKRYISLSLSLSLSLNTNDIKKQITLPFGSTLALIAIPRPTALGLQTGRHGRANRRV